MKVVGYGRVKDPFGRAFDIWAIERLTGRRRCSVEHSMSCIPLKGDPICGWCFEEDTAIAVPSDNAPQPPLKLRGGEGELFKKGELS